MWTELNDLVVTVFGGDYPNEPLALHQICARAVVVYVAGILIVRAGKSRIIGRATAVDVLLGFILGSLLSRGITGSGSISGTLAASFVLVGLHWLFTRFAFYSHAFGDLVKGHSYLLIKDGELQWENLRRSHISEHDLIEELRLAANIDDPKLVKAAYKERSGGVGVVLRDPPRSA